MSKIIPFNGKITDKKLALEIAAWVEAVTLMFEVHGKQIKELQSLVKWKNEE